MPLLNRVCAAMSVSAGPGNPQMAYRSCGGTNRGGCFNHCVWPDNQSGVDCRMDESRPFLAQALSG
jgi:hypothetical protein